MALKATPDWDTWFNNRREEFCAGMKVNVRDPFHRDQTTPVAFTRQAKKDWLCFGCRSFIRRGDLYGEATYYSRKYCLHCCTVKPIRGEQADDLSDARIRLQLGLLRKRRKGK